MSIYKRPESDIWWVSVSHPDHPRIRRSAGTTNRAEAERFRDELKAALWSAPRVDPGHTWGRAVEAWLDVEERSESELLSLRKFGRWATWHVQNGTPLDVLQKLGGWSDMRMVMTYAHHSPGYLATFADNARKK